MATSVGFICNSIESFSSHRLRTQGGDNLLGLIPYDNIKQNIYAQKKNLATMSPFISTKMTLEDIKDLNLVVYLSIKAVFFEIDEKDLANCASLIVHSALQYPDIQFSALCSEKSIWTKFYTLCNFIPNISVTPTLTIDAETSSLWLSAHLTAVILPAELFSIQRDRASLLNPDIAHMLCSLAERQVVTFFDTSDVNTDLYARCVSEITCNIQPQPLHYFLQAPLQPLSTHLSSAAYEHLQTDLKKYVLYQNSIAEALKDKGSDAVVAIVGAGRGPLVDRALSAGAKNVYVVEKNPAACIFLRERVKNDWNNMVQLFEGDMRSVTLPSKIDIIVSELLGGFGDNELSPECLLGCERFLAPGAISIPTSYTSYIVPITSEFLYAKALSENKIGIMSVVSMGAARPLGSEQPCFSFVHPGECQLHLSRSLEISIREDNTCHGFAGWFKCTLYKDIEMSSSPIDGTQNMFGWAPVYFPLPFPMKLRKSDIMTVTFLRKGNENGVWYEWIVTEPEICGVQNPLGSRFMYGLK